MVRHQDQARDDFGTILDELVFLIEQLARLPTRAEVRCIALRARSARWRQSGRSP
jgi:hypothetical protein